MANTENKIHPAIPPFARLVVNSWQQFAEVDITFHPRLTILTGANGSGKTTLLRLLAQHRGLPSSPLATPVKHRTSGTIEFLTRLFKGKDRSSETEIGKIWYPSGQSGRLVITGGTTSVSYQIAIDNQQPVLCFFIPSHRQIYRYQAIQNLPLAKKTEAAAFEEVNGIAMQRQGPGGTPASFFIKSTLIAWAVQGYGVKANAKTIMSSDESLRINFEGFQAVLRKLLPETLGFEELEIRGMELVFICNAGKDEFLLETASGGLASLIDFAWQIFTFAKSNTGRFAVLIDEVENHLHPTMQRSLLPDLLDAFPNATFIVATHSPLVVASVKDSRVYVLRYDSDNKIRSQQLDFEDRGMTAIDVLDDVLGVTSTLPIWVEEELAKILSEVTAAGVNEQTFTALRARLKSAKLESLFPKALTGVLGAER